MLSEAGDGIWIRGGDDTAEVDSDSDGEEGVEQDRVSGSEEEDGEGNDLSNEEEEDDDEEESNGAGFGGRFGALALEDAGAESTEEE